MGHILALQREQNSLHNRASAHFYFKDLLILIFFLEIFFILPKIHNMDGGTKISSNQKVVSAPLNLLLPPFRSPGQ